MKIISRLIAAILFVFFFFFALRNTQEVTLLARRGDLRKFWRRGPLASRLAGLSAI